VYFDGVDERAARTPDEPALVDDRRSWTWAEVADTLNRVGARLLDVCPDETRRVAVTGENVGETVLSHAAALRIGVGTVAMSRRVGGDELLRQLADARVSAIVCGTSATGLSATLRDARLSIPVISHAPTIDRAVALPWHDWASVTVAADGHGVRRPKPPLVYTSGTTGTARATEVQWQTGPMPPTAAEYVAAVCSRPSFPPGPHLVVGPLQHNGPLTSIRHLLAGQPVVIAEKFDPAGALALIDCHHVTSTVMVPTHFTRLLSLDSQQRSRFDVSSLQVVAHTGSACPAEVKREMIDWFGPVLVESYGGSELGTVCRITSEQWLNRPGSVGQAVEPLSVAAYDEAAKPLPTGQTGVLGVTLPPYRQVAYLGDADKSRRAYLAEGIVTLGDIGCVDAEGFVYITDRAVDMIVSGGVNLYPAEIERVLIDHDSVKDVAVIGVPDRDMGEALKALIVPEGAAPERETLDAFCRGRLEGPKCPRSYEFVTTLARNDMGKLDKRALRRPYWPTERTIGG